VGRACTRIGGKFVSQTVVVDGSVSVAGNSSGMVAGDAALDHDDGPATSDSSSEEVPHEGTRATIRSGVGTRRRSPRPRRIARSPACSPSDEDPDACAVGAREEKRPEAEGEERDQEGRTEGREVDRDPVEPGRRRRATKRSTTVSAPRSSSDFPSAPSTSSLSPTKPATHISAIPTAAQAPQRRANASQWLAGGLRDPMGTWAAAPRREQASDLRRAVPAGDQVALSRTVCASSPEGCNGRTA
jgi:hypothetical protein